MIKEFFDNLTEEQIVAFLSNLSNYKQPPYDVWVEDLASSIIGTIENNLQYDETLKKDFEEILSEYKNKEEKK